MKDSLEDHLRRLGFIYDAFSGIQIDINSAWKKGDQGEISASLCDHNCTLKVGGYDCPAAISANKGIIKKSLAPTEVLLKWILLAAKGLRSTRSLYLINDFDAQCKLFEIPPDVATAMRVGMARSDIEVNLFGGNPEMHPGILDLIRQLKSEGLRVNMTTTGRRLLRKPAFVEGLATSGLDLIAFSADDFNLDDLAQAILMDRIEIKTEWKKIPASHGQRQKAIEALHGAMLVRDLGEQFPIKILFNMVISRVNIRHVRHIIETLEGIFPFVLMNPFPAQHGFWGGKDLFKPDDLEELERLADWFIDRTLANERFFRRLQYWLLIKAVFATWSDPSHIAQAIDQMWRCYRAPGADRYLQIGRSPLTKSDEQHPGGYLGCFWNLDTVTGSTQIKSAAQVRSYLRGGMRELSKQAAHPCPGCSMPRLMHDLITTQAGMNPELIPAFLELRQKHAGF